MDTDNDTIYTLDLHGATMDEAKMVLDEVFAYIRSDEYIQEIHIVVGQGKGSESGPVLPAFVGNYVREKGWGFSVENGVIQVKIYT